MYKLINKKSLSDEVFGQIREQILSGQVAAGELLPSERLLCELFGVNRGAVREAMKRLEQAQLVQVRHGGGTRVLDYKQSAGIELLPALLIKNGQLDPNVVLGVMELRSALAKDIARLCALRADDEIVNQLQMTTEAMLESDDIEEWQQLNVVFWVLLVRGCGNIAYQLAFNALRKTFDEMRTVLRDVLSEEWKSRDLYRSISESVRDKDPTRAQEVTEKLVSRGNKILSAMFEENKKSKENKKPKKSKKSKANA